MSHHNRTALYNQDLHLHAFLLLIYLVQCNSMALISFLFCQCKIAFQVDTCHVISNISQLLPSVVWNRKFSDSNIVFQGQCPFPLLPCKTANGHFFFNSLPPSKLPDILRWENFLKFRPMVHCGANFQRRQYRPGWPSLPLVFLSEVGSGLINC